MHYFTYYGSLTVFIDHHETMRSPKEHVHANANIYTNNL